MVITLDVPYVDTTADTLALSLDEAPRRGLERRHLVVDQWAVQMVILAASHQMIVTGPGSTSLVETVACDIGAGPLPNRAHQAFGAYTHEFTSHSEQLELVEFRQRCEHLIHRLTEPRTTLIAEFPGRRHALTAISFDADPNPDSCEDAVQQTGCLGWQTWHTYPESGAVVHTTTKVLTTGMNTVPRTEMNTVPK